MSARYLVREIRYAPSCWPAQSVDAVEPYLVCPLCALTGRTSKKTAVLHHFIACRHQQCGKLSAVYAPDGLLPLFPAGGPTLLAALGEAEEQVRKALTEQGSLVSELMVIDDSRPVVTVSFRIERIRLPLPHARDGASVRGGRSQDESLVPPGGIPDPIARVLGRRSCGFGAGTQSVPGAPQT